MAAAMNAELTAADHATAETEGALANSLVLMASRAITWGLAFVMTVMLPRYLGAVGFGRLYFAIALTTVFAILVEFGLNSLVTREVARRHQEAWSYLVSGGVLKGLLWAFALVVIVAAMHVSSYPRDTQAAVLILTFGMAVTSLSSLVVAILQGLDRMGWIAAGQVAEKAVLTGLGVAVLLSGMGFVAVATVMLVSNIAGLLLNLYWFARAARAEPARLSGARIMGVRTLFIRSLPFFSVLFFGAIYFRIDVVILSLTAGDAAVGWYGAAYKLFETLTFFPSVFMFAFFPALCRLSVREDGSLAVAARKGLNWLMVVGVPVAAGTFLLSGDIIRLLYGAEGFAASVSVLRILSVTIAFLYANAALVWLLIATERQGKLAMTAGVAAVVNVLLNLVLIPRMAQVGCAVATLATEVVVLTLNAWFLPRDLARRLGLAVPARVLAAGGVMVPVVVGLRGQPLPVVIAAGAATYAVAALLLGALPGDDITMMKNALLRLKPGVMVKAGGGS